MNKPMFFERYASIAYLSLAFVLSWGLIIVLAGPGNIPIDPEQSQSLLPLLYVMMLVGPSVAGIVSIGLINGVEGLRNLRSQLFRWKVGIRWYLLALFTAPIVAIAILLILSQTNTVYTLGIFGAETPSTIALIGLITGLMVGIFEEIGWSGFLVPYLRKRYSIVITGLIVGFFWGAWHFILFWESDSFLGNLPLFILLGRLFAWLPPYRIFMVWILDRTKSLLLVILTHASLVFTTTVLVPMTLAGVELLIWLIVWGVILWLIVLGISVFKKHAG